MSFLWDLYWPLLTAAAVIGVITGRLAYKVPGQSGENVAYRRKRNLTLVIGVAAILLAGWVWHGPVGAGQRFTTETERFTRRVLVDFEMAPIKAVVAQNPLKRSLVLSGQADDFQRSELVRILNDVPGVGEVHWANQQPGFALPLLLEVELAALISFGVGLLLAYLLELRRRSNAQWRW